MNNNLSSTICQQQTFLSNPELYLQNASVSEIESINTLVNYSNIYGTVYASQDTMADKAGISRRTFIRNTNKFQEDGLAIKRYQHRKTSSYYLNPLFFDASFRNRFKKIITALKWIPIHLILSVSISTKAFSNSSLCEYVTPYKKSLSYTNLLTNTHLSLNTVLEGEELSHCYMSGDNKSQSVISTENKHFNVNNQPVTFCHDLKKEVEVGVVMIDKIRDELKLSEYQVTELREFDEKTLVEAWGVLLKKGDVKYKYSFVLACCKNIVKKIEEKSSTKGDYNASQQVVRKPVAWVNTEKPVERTIEYIKSQIEKVKAHDMPQFMTGEGMLFAGIKEKLLENLYEELIKLESDNVAKVDSVAEDIQSNTTLPTVKGIPTAFELAEYLAVLKKNGDWAKIGDIINVEYTVDGNNNDMVAEYYIKTVKDYLGSIEKKEKDSQRLNTQSTKKEATQLKFDGVLDRTDNDDMYEEILD